MLEFKLNLYFQEYKDSPVMSSTKFKSEFKKKHGDFPLVSELFIMIQKYQLKKYGSVIDDGKNTYKRRAKFTYSNLENNRKIRKLGTKEERNKRKLEERYGR